MRTCLSPALRQSKRTCAVNHGPVLGAFVASSWMNRAPQFGVCHIPMDRGDLSHPLPFILTEWVPRFTLCHTTKGLLWWTVGETIMRAAHSKMIWAVKARQRVAGVRSSPAVGHVEAIANMMTNP